MSALAVGVAGEQSPSVGAHRPAHATARPFCMGTVHLSSAEPLLLRSASTHRFCSGVTTRNDRCRQPACSPGLAPHAPRPSAQRWCVDARTSCTLVIARMAQEVVQTPHLGSRAPCRASPMSRPGCGRRQPIQLHRQCATGGVGVRPSLCQGKTGGDRRSRSWIRTPPECRLFGARPH